MGAVTFVGTISAQIAAGETVSIKVKKPDSTEEILTTTTKADKSFSIVKAIDVAGNYSAIASIPANEGYLAASSPSVPFVVCLQPRSVTLNVSVA